MKKFWIPVLSVLIALGTRCMRDRSVNSDHADDLLIHILLNGPNYEGDFYEGFLPPTEYALWVEDQEGHCLITLEITPTAVTVDSIHGSHIEHLPVWAEAAGMTYDLLAQTTESGIPAAFDGITAASPALYQNPDTPLLIEKAWDLTKEGLKIKNDMIYICFEAANIIKYTSDETVTVVSEHTKSFVDLNGMQTVPAAATPHILELTVSFP
jgi:hypothetical protein